MHEQILDLTDAVHPLPGRDEAARRAVDPRQPVPRGRTAATVAVGHLAADLAFGQPQALCGFAPVVALERLVRRPCCLVSARANVRADRAALPLPLEHHHQEVAPTIAVENQARFDAGRRGEVEVEPAMAEAVVFTLGAGEQAVDGLGRRGGDRADPVGFPDVGQALVAYEPRAVGVEHLVSQREHRLIDSERAAGEVAQGARRSSTGGYVPAGNVEDTPVCGFCTVSAGTNTLWASRCRSQWPGTFTTPEPGTGTMRSGTHCMPSPTTTADGVEPRPLVAMELIWLTACEVVVGAVGMITERPMGTMSAPARRQPVATRASWRSRRTITFFIRLSVTPASVGVEAVAHALDRRDAPLLGAELGAQAADVHVDRTGFDLVGARVPPHAVQQVLARQHAPGRL